MQTIVVFVLPIFFFRLIEVYKHLIVNEWS